MSLAIKVGQAGIHNPAAGRLFGTSADNNPGHASRLIVRDAELDVSDEAFFRNTELPYTEAKTEADINRITSKA